MDVGVGVAEFAHRDDVSNGPVEWDHLHGVGIAEDEILHGHEVEEVHDKAVERFSFGWWKGVVGDFLEVENDLDELLGHGVEVGLPVGSVESLGREFE